MKWRRDSGADRKSWDPEPVNAKGTRNQDGGVDGGEVERNGGEWWAIRGST